MLERGKIGYYRSDDPGEPTTGKPRWSVSDNEANILAALGAGREVTEIGTGTGFSTKALARHAWSVITHDIDTWVHESVWPELIDLGIGCAKERSVLTLCDADLVFIDADHATTAVLDDIAFARSFDSHPLIVCHDSNYPNVRRAIPDDWTFIETEHGLAFGY